MNNDFTPASCPKDKCHIFLSGALMIRQELFTFKKF